MAQIDDLPPLREVIAKHDLAAKKSLGQNFLLDLNLTMRIARSVGDLKNFTILEVGPGPGGLTRALLAAGAKKVIAIEKDQRCLPALREISERYPGRLTVIEGDALQFDPSTLTEQEPIRIVANLPYNVGTQLLLNWLSTSQWPPFWSSLTLMFQKEVAERITAAPRTKSYGRLGVLTGWRCKGDILFDVGPKAFTPPPKVSSAIVHLVPNLAPISCDIRNLEKITAAAFGQRRKMLRASLKPLVQDTELFLKTAGIEPTLRAEQVDVDGFVRLANKLQKLS